MVNMLILLVLINHSFVLSIEPTRIAGLNVNDTFRVSVNAYDVAHVYGYNVSIIFDSLILKALQVTQGPFLRRFGSTIWIPPTILPGKIENAAEALFAPSQGAVGSGTLFTVKFQVKASGNSLIHFFTPEVMFSNPQGDPLVSYFCILDAWYGTQTLETRPIFNITPGATNVQEMPSAVWFTPVSRYVVTWQDKRSGNYDIYGQQVNTDGTLYGANYVICDSIGDQLEPVITYNPTGGLFSYGLVVWTDYRRGADSADIYGRLLYRGSPVSTAEFPIAKYPGFQNNPTIAPCGSRYLVVWQDRKDKDTSLIYGQLLTYQGGLIGSRFQISPSFSANYDWNYNLQPSIAGADSAFLVTWTHSRSYYYSGTYELRGKIIDTLGNQGSIITITSAYTYAAYYNSSSAFDGTNYLVVWSMWQDQGEKLKSIRGQFVSKTGGLVGTNFLIYSTPESLVQAPRVQFTGVNYLIVWDEEAGGIDYIKGIFVTTNGNVGAPFILYSAPYQQTFPSSAGDVSSNSIVVWQDYRSGTDYDIWGYLGPPIGIEETPGLNSKIQNPKLEVYPNPFREKMIIRYTIQDAGYKIQDMGLKIYDITGRLVKSFNLSTRYSLLASSVEWDGTDDSGIPVESGVYFAKFGSETVKFVFLR